MTLLSCYQPCKVWFSHRGAERVTATNCFVTVCELWFNAMVESPQFLAFLCVLPEWITGGCHIFLHFMYNSVDQVPSKFWLAGKIGWWPWVALTLCWVSLASLKQWNLSDLFFSASLNQELFIWIYICWHVIKHFSQTLNPIYWSSALSMKTAVSFSLFASMLSSTMYVFGGFNSLLLSDILKFTPERCEAFGNESSCLGAGPGLRCVWALRPPRCLPWENATLEQQQKVFEDCPPKPGRCPLLCVPCSGRCAGLFSFWTPAVWIVCCSKVRVYRGAVSWEPFLWPGVMGMGRCFCLLLLKLLVHEIFFLPCCLCLLFCP